MLYLTIILLLTQLILFVSAAKSTGKGSNIRYGIGIFIGAILSWMLINNINSPKEITNHTSESR